ncbi:MAG TPA: NAD(P)H-dependent oxidoreductase [Candidatus Saccharimonadales bacterium]|nr:NAD(P)H-dependent oxidoreductase [Candidatus Saccharimonadales bacterium]
MTIGVILGSTRPERFGEKPAQWLMDLTKKFPEATFTLIDLAEQNLPFLDEAIIPAYGNYQNSHTKKWAELIAGLDGFVVITSEYNHSIPAALKNAFDYLLSEWSYKPVGFIGYGADAGGQRAVEQLRGMCGFLNMFDLSEHVTITRSWEAVDEQGNFAPTADHQRAAQAMLEKLIFWAKHFKQARKELA